MVYNSIKQNVKKICQKPTECFEELPALFDEDSEVEDTINDDSAATSDTFLSALLPMASFLLKLLLGGTTGLEVQVLLSQLLFVEPSSTTPFPCVDEPSNGLFSSLLFTCIDDDGVCDADVDIDKDEDGLSTKDTGPFSALELEPPAASLVLSFKAPLSAFGLSDEELY